MPYNAEISRANPTCFLFLIDQSESMRERIGGGDVPMAKADAVADAVNRLLSELSVKCAKEEGVRDYFHVGVIGYGAKVGPAFGGVLAGQSLVPISQVAASPARLEERPGANGRTVRVPSWFIPTAYGDTPMCAALTEAHDVLGKWLAEHPGSFPPIVLNITDGESTDGDPSGPAEAVRELMSADGGALLFNLHVSSDLSDPIVFPNADRSLPDDYARMLFRMSSVLPGALREAANEQGLALAEDARGFVFNADISAIVQFLHVGTQVLGLR
jgi:hypothetical protein